MPKVNCLIPVWSGPRRIESVNYSLDKTVYLDKQMRQMKEIKHDLDQITIINSFNPEESSRFRRFLDTLPSNIGRTKIEVIERQNIGMSYGAYSDAYSHYRDAFDYYIFLEDDYIMVMDSFESILVSICDAEQADYLCQFTSVWPQTNMPHAAISNGIVKQEALEAVWRKFGKLPHAGLIHYDWHPDKREFTVPGQVRFSSAFIEAGKEIKDLRKYFKVPYIDHFIEGREIREYFPENKDYLIVPIQMSYLWGDNG